MVDNDDWTPLIGWRKAAWRIPLRAAIAAGIAWAAFWVLWVFIQFLSSESGTPITMINWGLPLVLVAGAGVAGGWVLSRGLMESTGLLGSYLAGPSLTLFIGNLLLAQWLTGRIIPGWEQISFWVLVTSGILGCGLAIRQFWVDS